MSETEFNVFPNPSNGIVNIDFNKAFTIEIVDVAGNIVQKRSNVSSVKIEIPGVYFFNFTENNTVKTQKVIVK
ncbi:MAG: T9SS type A sorting domain-containing protein [Crocinitomicaceae bacterium]|nr:T9SS type A sorting domain-containing protein [Crocinitomicaceae bacterium]